MKRITKPGGKLLIVDWSGASEMSPNTVFSSEKAKTLFEKNGFKIDQTFDAGDHHYGLVFIR